jgi:hypothetical protein
MYHYAEGAVRRASEVSQSFHAADFDGVWDSLPDIRMITKVIITGRSWEEAIGTFHQMNDPKFIGRRAPIYFNPVRKGIPNVDNISAWKSEMIKRLGVTDFWEDDPEEAKIIETMCPGVAIHLVNSSHAKGN